MTTREDIDTAVLDAIADLGFRRPDLDESVADLGLDGRMQAVVEVALEDRFGQPIPLAAEWSTPRELAALVADQLLSQGEEA